MPNWPGCRSNCSGCCSNWAGCCSAGGRSRKKADKAAKRAAKAERKAAQEAQAVVRDVAEGRRRRDHGATIAGSGEPALVAEVWKAKAREAGLWNFFLPDSEVGGLSNLDYAYIATELGKYPLGSESLNCSAPDTGNMEVLERVGTPEQKKQWLEPLLQGEIRSAVAQAVGLQEHQLTMGIDGCSAPNYAMPLAHLATGFARLAPVIKGTGMSASEASTTPAAIRRDRRSRRGTPRCSACSRRSRMRPARASVPGGGSR